MITYQDFIAEPNRAAFVARAISQHISDPMYKMAVIADEYSRQCNTTINQFTKKLYTMSGGVVDDYTAANYRIASNFFYRLNTQRCTYSLGNGISFSDHRRTELHRDGSATTIDDTKARLGGDFDTALFDAAYKALIHGVSFGFWNVDALHVFPLTEFVPLWDEDTGALRAGIRFWRLADTKPMTAEVYEEDGYTVYRTKVSSSNSDFVMVQDKTPYKAIIQRSDAEGEQVVGGENYSGFPVVPLWGSKLHQSTLVGMRAAIDSYDLVQSGFADDLADCAQVYWIVSNAMGMSDDDLARFRDKIKLHHIAVADTDNSNVTPYTQDIPYQARSEFLSQIRASIYEAFGALDVHTVAAGATNDHIDAAYQPMDENADDFEYQIITFVRQILALMGIEDTPIFKRNRVSNQKEQVDIVIAESPYLDDETILQKLPNITADEISGIITRRGASADERFENGL